MANSKKSKGSSFLRRMKKKRMAAAPRITYDFGEGPQEFVLLMPGASEYEQMMGRCAEHAEGKMATEPEAWKEAAPDPAILSALENMQSQGGLDNQKPPANHWELMYRWHFSDMLGRLTMAAVLRDSDGSDLCKVDDDEAPAEIVANRKAMAQWRATEYARNQQELMDLIGEHPAVQVMIAESLQKKTMAKVKPTGKKESKGKQKGKGT